LPRMKQPRNVAQARALRQNLPLPEALLWRELRQQSEVKFRRQHPIGPYILDFYCAKAKVGVEIDEVAHDMGDRPERDATRDLRLGDHGIEVMRIAASEVLGSPQAVAESLVAYCRR
jgi:very-short-patch-repair endonuclease